MDSVEIKEYAKDWYEFGRNILPEFDSPLFATIAGEANAFSYMVNPDAKGITLQVTNKCETAYVDLKSNAIFISAKYFSPTLYSARYGAEGRKEIERLAIALINGSVIHEALHIKHTESGKNIPEILTSYGHRYSEMKRKFGEQVVCSTFNIIEDLYIEGQIEKALSSWLQATSDILFSEDDCDKAKTDLTQIGNYLNLAVLYKNKELRGHEVFESFNADQLRVLAEVSKPMLIGQAARVQATWNFLDFFEGEFDSSTDKASESVKKGEGESGDDMAEALEGTPMPSDEEADEVAAEVKDAADEITEDKETYHTFVGDGHHYPAEWRDLIEEDINKAEVDDYGRITPTNSINFSFLKELVAMRTLNRTPGQARNRGSVMVKSRLTRIATDGKIFAKRDAERQTLKRIEVIINVDLSGSTGGTVADNEMGAAMEMSKVLRAARVAHSVYGHTSTSYSGSDTPYLVHIFSYDMMTTNQDFDSRFKRACGISLRQNYDGVVINTLAERFTEKSATRYLINLSDGQPAAPDYSGPAANAHTKLAIKNLRAKNVGVFSISVVSGVVSANNRIYGEEYNVDGSRDTVGQFRKLIKKLVGGN